MSLFCIRFYMIFNKFDGIIFQLEFSTKDGQNANFIQNFPKILKRLRLQQVTPLYY